MRIVEHRLTDRSMLIWCRNMDEWLPWALESIQGNILCGRLIRVIQQHVRSLEMSQSSVIRKVWNVCLNLHGSEQKCIQPVCRSLIEESVWMVAVTHAWLFAQISLRILIWNVCVCVWGKCLSPPQWHYSSAEKNRKFCMYTLNELCPNIY